MNVSLADKSKWLALTQASKMLGIHPTTLRDWVDEGVIASFHTPGGHRRFAESDIQAFIATSKIGKPHCSIPVATKRTLAQMHAKLKTTDAKPLLAAFNTKERIRHRELGRQLTAILVQHLTPNTHHDADSQNIREIGVQYSRECRAQRLPLTEAMRIFLFFSRAVTEAAVESPRLTGLPRQEILRVLKQFHEVLDAIHIAIIESYTEQKKGK
jgi:excisionase family DNA binding protein